MINIAICDYNKKDAELIATILEKFNEKNPDVEMEVNKFFNVSKLIKSIEKEGFYDIYIIDVIMKGIKGIEFGRFLRNIDKNSTIIYVTESKEFALDAYVINANRYILKPIKEKEFLKIFTEEVKMSNIRNSKTISINSKKGFKRIAFDEIVYVNTKSHIVFLHLTNGEIIETKTMRKSFDYFIKELIEDERFIKPHYSFLVNLDYVETMNSKEFEMKYSKKTPIAKNKAEYIKKRYLSY